ncbi:MAG: biotin--[acetyl-CoA-carboxylase] ligase [bacterium]|nr:biotin--[acetyl-CoA-carboxylase] ligase [bacterium]
MVQKKTTISNPNLSEIVLEDPEKHWIGISWEHYQEIDSTQLRAIELLKNGCIGAVVTACKQNSGLGRLGKSFWSPYNLGMYLSVTLPPPKFEDRYQLLTLWAGLVVIRAIREAGIILNSVPVNFTSRLSIKWPNDVLLDGKKVAGILMNSIFNGSTPLGFVMGVGINLNQIKHDFPVELQNQATSIRMVTNEQWDVQQFTLHFIQVIEKMWLHLEQPIELLLSNWLRWGPTIGKDTVVKDKSEIKGKFVGLTTSGEIVIQVEDGSKHYISNGIIET